MTAMFAENTAFNQPLNSWNTSHVTDMSFMFCSANRFNQPLDNWDTSSVKDMSSMFMDAFAFNQDLSSWNTDSVTNIQNMFCGALSFCNGTENHGFGSWKLPLISDPDQAEHFLAGAVSFNFTDTEIPEICRRNT
jgi:surface protein